MTESRSEISTALLSRGFQYVGYTSRREFKYSGYILASIGPLQIDIHIRKSDQLPIIRLVEIPEKLKPLSPHISPNGNLCYAAQGSIALDIFRPAGQILACIDRATEVLDQILAGERIEDLADEFFIYWDSNDCIYIDLNDFDSKYLLAALITKAGKDTSTYIMTESLQRTRLKLAAMGYDAEVEMCGTFVLKTTANPLPMTQNSKWPPKTLADLINWQEQLDSVVAKKIIKRVLWLTKLKMPVLIALFSSPTALYAAGIILGNDIYNGEYRKQGKRKLEKILSSEIRILPTFRMDDHYIVERNQPGRISLMNKKILLIGCGTIGGYLAELLVKSGAGLGKGEFVLLDTENMSPGNIGRHRLGINSLFKNKAEALAEELKIGMPSSNVVGIPMNGLEMNHENFDLIINATGEQALSDALSFKINKGKFVPNLHCWIEGPGIAVRSFIQNQQTEACYRCLSDDNRVVLYPATSVPYPQKMAGHGCESLYVPFSATVSVFAAALAAEQVIDFINTQAKPNFLTIVIDRSYQSDYLEVNPNKLSNCPACSS